MDTVVKEKPQHWQAHYRSMLGQILVRKGYLHQEQLDKAVHALQGRDQRLGEYLIEHRMLARWQLRRALISQSRLRLSVALAVALLTPVNSILAGESVESYDNDYLFLLQPLLTAMTFTFDPTSPDVTIMDDNIIRLRVASSLGVLDFDGLRLRRGRIIDSQTLSLQDLDLAGATVSVLQAGLTSDK